MVGSQLHQTATGTSKSAVSRRFVGATEHACVVALGITLDGD